MDVNATVDIGANIIGLIQQLATQLGVTASTVFPWYVKQAYIEGWTNLIIQATCLFVSIIMIAVGNYVGKWTENFPSMVGIAGCIILSFSFMATTATFSDNLNKINNSEKAALSMMIKDVRKLTKK